MLKKENTLGGILLVAGTAIGGGMLALPVLTSGGGFFPAILILFACWLFMACTGILLMEVFLWGQKDSNILSMAEMTLGKIGKYAAALVYIFLFYSLSVAYVAGGGGIALDLVELGAHVKMPCAIGPLLFVGLFAPFVIAGSTATGRINALLMVGLIASFVLFLVLGASHVQSTFLTRKNFALALLATPVTFTSFGFQGIVPTLTNYLDRNPKKTILVILVGTFIPFLIYCVWEWLILGVIPYEGLEEALRQGESAIAPLKNILHLPWLFRLGECFAFFTIVTSFLGVTLGLLDFLSDGLKIKKDFKGKSILSLLVFFPPLIFSMLNPCIFLHALHYAGGFGCAILLGLFPLLMVWRGRYSLGFKSAISLPGGKIFLSCLMLFIVFELAIMMWQIA